MQHAFRYEHCDIPAGRTIAEHRRARAQARAAARGRRLLWIVGPRRAAATPSR